MHDTKIEIKGIKRPDAIEVGRAMERAGFDSVEEFARYALWKISNELIEKNKRTTPSQPAKQPA